MNNSLQTASAKVSVSANYENREGGGIIHLHKLKNKNGVEATITNHGVRIVSLLIPDRHGNMIDVIAGHEKPNALHDGKNSSGAAVWDVEQFDHQTVDLRYNSKNMEGNFPGNLKVKRTYVLNDDNVLKIIYEAITDKTIVMNLANNAFFNLNGKNNGNILNHQVWIKADHYMPIDANMSPTGVIESVAGTPFDFRNSATIGSRINDHHVQLTNGNGYDHNFVLNKHSSRTPVARIRGDKSGIIMEIFTDQPGLQFYSGNFMKSKHVKKDGDKDDCYTAFAMKTRHFSDLPTPPVFPLTALRPGQVYRSVYSYQFKN